MDDTFNSLSSHLTLVLYFVFKSLSSRLRLQALGHMTSSLVRLNGRVASQSRRTLSHQTVRSTASAGVRPLLKVLSAFIAGLRSSSARDRWLLYDVLVPLHEPMGYAIHRDQVSVISPYHMDLTRCVVYFLRRAASPNTREAFARTVINKLLQPNIWPTGSSSNTSKVS